MTLSPGDTFGPYRLEERLGAGGLAEVWRAVDTATGQIVALKRFSGALASADAEKLRADVELLAAHALGGHPNVVAVYGGGPEPSPHVVMEYLDGGDLGDELAAKGKLTIERTLEIGTAVASALAAASEAGIIHGDLKPSNALLGRDAAIKLADFNVARVVGYTGSSVSGTLLLSFAYAAPEVWDGKPTASSDLYALGCIFYECLTGAQPFAGTYTDVFRGHIERTPDLDRLPADAPADLRVLIGELLAKDPTARPADAASVLARLTAIRAELGAHASDRLPAALGPWLTEAPHPVQPWAWRARHKDTGQAATLELLFGDKALGERLHSAVDVNAQLVPLGAERLLGTNRLLLRPGEGLGRPTPKGSWIYWVAREELPLPPPAWALDAAALAAVARRMEALLAAASSARITLDLSPANISVLPDGSLHLRRPGLPGSGTADPEETVLASLRKLAVPGLLPAIAGATSLAELRDTLAHSERTTAPHAFQAATTELPRFEPTVKLPKQTPARVVAARIPPPLPPPPAALVGRPHGDGYGADVSERRTRDGSAGDDGGGDRFGGMITAIAVVAILGLGVVGVIFLPGLLTATPTLSTALPTGLLSPSLPPSATGTPLITAAPTAEMTPTPGPTPRLYRIKASDKTLTQIAHRFGITLRQLLDANPQITDPNHLEVGMVIVIPTSTASPAVGVVFNEPASDVVGWFRRIGTTGPERSH